MKPAIKNETIDICTTPLEGEVLENCTIVYDGECSKVTVMNNNFIKCQFKVVGKAATTFKFFNELLRMGVLKVEDNQLVSGDSKQ